MCSPKRKDLLSHPPTPADRTGRYSHCGNWATTMRRTSISSMTGRSTSILSVVPMEATRGPLEVDPEFFSVIFESETHIKLVNLRSRISAGCDQFVASAVFRLCNHGIYDLGTQTGTAH